MFLCPYIYRSFLTNEKMWGILNVEKGRVHQNTKEKELLLKGKLLPEQKLNKRRGRGGGGGERSTAVGRFSCLGENREMIKVSKSKWTEKNSLFSLLYLEVHKTPFHTACADSWINKRKILSREIKLPVTVQSSFPLYAFIAFIV